MLPRKAAPPWPLRWRRFSGPVFCKNDNLLCRRAGKEFVVDDFKTDQMVVMGKI